MIEPGTQKGLIGRYDGAGWHAVDAPNPGTGDNVLGAIAATGNDVWALGYDKTGSGRDPSSNTTTATGRLGIDGCRGITRGGASVLRRKSVRYIG
jgi:hypothetical protein